MTPEYRYLLVRRIPGLVGKGSVLFVMLNPSTADETNDDPTIRRCIDFASLWKVRELRVVNLFAMRATNPQELVTAHERGEDIIGPENDETIRREIIRDPLAPVVMAWGASLGTFVRQRAFAVLLGTGTRHRWRCLGLTATGAPRHPLYVRRTQCLEPWPRPASSV